MTTGKTENRSLPLRMSFPALLGLNVAFRIYIYIISFTHANLKNETDRMFDKDRMRVSKKCDFETLATLNFLHALSVAIPRKHIPVGVIDTNLSSTQLRKFPRSVSHCSVLINEFDEETGLDPAYLSFHRSSCEKLKIAQRLHYWKNRITVCGGRKYWHPSSCFIAN